MKQYNNIRFEIDNNIGIITISRPKAMNAINTETLQELDSLLNMIAADELIKAVIITGAGERAFIAGADIPEMLNMSPMGARNWVRFGQMVINKIENLPQPVIAAVNGVALGGGCELVMACDICISSDAARFGQPEVSLGITPGYAGTQRLPRLVGKNTAKELLFTGDIIDAQTAYRIGLVNKVVPAQDLLNSAMALAGKIISRSKTAVELCKSAVNKGMEMDLNSAMAYESEVFGLCFSTVEQKEGMRAFMEKRKANF